MGDQDDHLLDQRLGTGKLLPARFLNGKPKKKRIYPKTPRYSADEKAFTVPNQGGYRAPGSPISFLILERRQQVYEHYKNGKSMREIGKLVGVSTMQVSRDLHAMIAILQERTLKLAGEVRHVHLDRIQEALKAIYGRVLHGDYDAIMIMLRLMEREAKLIGLDAPTKIDIEARILAIAKVEGIDPQTALRVARQAADEEQRKIMEAAETE
jgi:hypothetical protein